MSPREIAARALGVGPSDVVSIEPIKHGLTNESWLVHVRDDAVVVRVSNRHWASLQIDRHTEAQVLEIVGRAAIGPEVLACDLTEGILVTRYLGPTCTEERMTDPAIIDALGEVYRKLHALGPIADMREVHLPTVIAGYIETLETLNRSSPLMDAEMRTRGLMLAAEIADSCTPTLCHNDVHHLNVIDVQPLRLLDWEYAGVGEPYFDLAAVCSYHHYSLNQRAQLLHAYVDNASAANMERLAKCCWLFEYVRDLWFEVRSSVEAREAR